MAKYIRDHQLEDFSTDDDYSYRPRKKKVKKFKDNEDKPKKIKTKV
jgi:hypothetical protein